MFTRKTSQSLIPVRIGGLLISAGFIRSDHMAMALATARSQNRKLGEILIANGWVSDEDLKCALELQKLIKEGSITMEMGVRALKESRTKSTTVKTALSQMGWTDENAIKTTDLASLLIEAQIISREQLDQASWNAAKNMLPLGRNLVLAGAVTPSVLGAALNVLVLLRDNQVSREQARKALRAVHQQKLTLEETMPQLEAIAQNHLRVGELLSTAGLLSESDAMIAVENGLLNKKSIGQVLLESRMVSPLVLDACLKLQKMIYDAQMTRVQACELLRQVATRQVALEQFLSEMSYLKSRVLELITKAGLVNDREIEHALSVAPEGETDIIRALFLTNAISQDIFRTAVRCVYGIDEKQYTVDEMVTVLRTQFGAAHRVSSAASRTA